MKKHRFLALLLVSVLGLLAPYRAALGQSAPTSPSAEAVGGFGSKLRGPGTFIPNMHTFSVSDAIADKFLTVDIGPSTALANSTTYVSTVPVGFAGTVMAVYVACSVPPVGGTNTVTVQKDGTTNLLAAGTFNPTTLVAYTGQSLPLATTTGNLTCVATDTITVTWTSGTQTTAAQAPTVTILYAPLSSVDF